MKYKVGDKVRVRADLITDKVYGLLFVNSMNYLKGEVVTIKEVEEDGCYIMEENGYSWTDGMIESKVGEKVDIDTTTIIKNRDFSVLQSKKVKARDGIGYHTLEISTDDIVIATIYGTELVETNISCDVDKDLVESIFSLYGYKVEIDDRKVISDVKELHMLMQENEIVWNGKDFYEIMSDEGVSFIGIEALQDRFDVVIDIC